MLLLFLNLKLKCSATHNWNDRKLCFVSIVKNYEGWNLK